MKKLVVVLATVAIASVSFMLGATYQSYQSWKDYQAACMLSDICLFAHDNLGNDFDEIYEDYIMNIDCDPNATITEDEIRQYHWIYKD